MTKTVIILMANDGIYFNRTFFVPYSRTNLPDKKHFHFYDEIFWKAAYSFKNGVLSLRIIDYAVHKYHIGDFYTRTPKNESSIKNIYFEKLHWPDFENNLIQYNKGDILGITNYETLEYNFNLDNYNLSPSKSSKNSFSDIDHEEEFWVHIEDVKFIDGGVKFNKCFKWSVGPLEIEIPNQNIIKEFDLIKYAFAKKFGTKNRIRVKFHFKKSYTEGVNQIAFSEQISTIDEDYIEEIKIQRTINLAKKVKPYDREELIYDLKEIFNRINNEDIGENIFEQTEEDVIDILCTSHEVRNARHIRYLSKTKQSEDEKIKFSISPKFGFLFCVHGGSQSHIVLELLNSNATYIWSFDKTEDIERTYMTVNHEIGKIEEVGRQKYKSELAGKNFHCLFHKGIETDPKQGFQEWKNDLGSKII